MTDCRTVVVPVLDRRTDYFCDYAKGPSLDPADMDRFHTARFDGEKLFSHALMQQIEHLWHLGEKPGHILLGRDFFAQFFEQAVENMRHFGFDIPPKWPGYSLHPGWLFAGVRIHCVPWMEGVVVVPKLCPCGKDIAPLAAENGNGAVGLPISLVGDINSEDVPSGVAEKVAEWLKMAAVDWYSKPPKRFMRSRRFLWWWR